MDENEFFREATLRICGNLKFEEALYSLFQLIKQLLPVKHMYLQYFDTDYNAMRTVAHADESGGKALDLLTPLSQEAREHAGNAPPDQYIFLMDSPTNFPITREMQDFHGIESSSIIVMSLRQDQDMMGFLVLTTEGDEKFKKDDLKWILMIKDPLLVAMSNTLKHREVIKFNELLSDDNRYLHNELHRMWGDEIIGANFGLREAMFKVQQVAALDSPVLLLGETGVGKDVIANAIHYSSPRNDGPFIKVNCGAIPDTLIDSELFGHEKGAFTGALAQRRGRFERAHNGTIFLDEIGELPLQAQVRLLTVLQSKEIERVGGVKTIPLNIRIIAATNRNLEEMVKEQKFREDLWFRLNVFPIHIPPLRERVTDIPALLQHFITQKSQELKLPDIPSVSPGVTDVLMGYGWPGNVRELQNVVERELILNTTGPLTFSDMMASATSRGNSLHTYTSDTDNLDEITAKHIRNVLSKTGGKIHGQGGAAALLGINANTLRNRMNKLGIAYKKNV